MEDPVVQFVVRKCPFLHGVAKSSPDGEASARSIALGVPAAPAQRRPIVEEMVDVKRTFELFHGPAGVTPLRAGSSAQLALPILPTFSSTQVSSTSPNNAPAPGCPMHAAAAAQGCPFHQRQHQPQPQPQPAAVAPQRQAAPVSPQVSAPSALDGSFLPRAGGASAPRCGAPLGLGAPLPLPLASLSLGAGFPDFQRFFQQHFGSRARPKAKKPDASASSASPAQQLGPSSAPSGAPGLGSGSSVGPAQAAGGTCPMRRALGPFAGLVFNKHGQISCPEPIIKMRAALAATKPVRELRPQALPVKFAAIGLAAALLNVPCGMWREHTEKFSGAWFVAVHATIPFIAMLRKAVVMPKYAILLTVAAAIIGQQMGAKLERARLLAQEATPAVPAPQPSPRAAKHQRASKQAGASSTSRAGGDSGHAALASASLGGSPAALAAGWRWGGAHEPADVANVSNAAAVGMWLPAAPARSVKAC